MKVEFGFSFFMSLLLALLALFGVTLPAAGCAPNTTEAERAWMFVATNVIQPVAEKAIAETSTRTATIQAGAQVINPGYRVEVDGYLVQGFKGLVSVRLEGVSGQITGHAQGDAGQAAPTPVITLPTAATTEEVRRDLTRSTQPAP